MEKQVAANLALWETKARFITLAAVLFPLIKKDTVVFTLTRLVMYSKCELLAHSNA